MRQVFCGIILYIHNFYLIFFIQAFIICSILQSLLSACLGFKLPFSVDVIIDGNFYCDTKFVLGFVFGLRRHSEDFQIYYFNFLICFTNTVTFTKNISHILSVYPLIYRQLFRSKKNSNKDIIYSLRSLLAMTIASGIFSASFPVSSSEAAKISCLCNKKF